jgi:hypothetical protein
MSAVRPYLTGKSTEAMTEQLKELRVFVQTATERTAAVSLRLGGELAARAGATLNRCRMARRGWHRLALFVLELAGVVLVSYGIAQWSWPCAVIIGGLVLIGVVEVRPSTAPRMPDLPPPEDLLRRQAENAAIVINNDRYGLAFVDTDRLAQLSIAECEQLVITARNLGVKT